MENKLHVLVRQRIRGYRKLRGWSQEQLAEAAELHLSTVGQIERGIKIPSLDTIQAIAHALGIKSGKLLDEGSLPKMSNQMGQRLVDLMAGCTPKETQALYRTFKTMARQVRKISKNSH